MQMKLVKLLVLAPLAIFLVVISVANRQPIMFSLDPLSNDNPALSIELPLFALLFVALLTGVVMGSFVTWWNQGRYRRQLREKSYEANQLQRQKVSSEDARGAKEREEIAPGLPAIVTRARAN